MSCPKDRQKERTLSYFETEDFPLQVGAQARLLTLADLTATCMAHSVHSKVSAEAVP